MQLTVNGKKIEYGGSPRMKCLMQELGIDTRPVVVERNFRIVPWEEIENEPVAEGDLIEIVHLVGGG